MRGRTEITRRGYRGSVAVRRVPGTRSASPGPAFLGQLLVGGVAPRECAGQLAPAQRDHRPVDGVDRAVDVRHPPSTPQEQWATRTDDDVGVPRHRVHASTPQRLEQRPGRAGLLVEAGEGTRGTRRRAAPARPRRAGAGSAGRRAARARRRRSRARCSSRRPALGSSSRWNPWTSRRAGIELVHSKAARWPIAAPRSRRWKPNIETALFISSTSAGTSSTYPPSGSSPTDRRASANSWEWSRSGRPAPYSS